MATAGHNNPPPLEAFSLHIEDLFSTASGSVASPVTNDEQEQALDELLDEIRQARKAADEQRAIEKRPHDEAAKAVQTSWKPLLDRCDAATKAIKDALTPYREAKLKAREEAIQKAREEAEAREAAAREALQSSDDLEAKFAAEEELKQAGKLKAIANRVDREATGLRSQQVAEVTDRRALLEYVMQHDPDTLTEWLTDYARKALPAQLPGVTIRIDRRAA